jgi:hypothetical protein
MNDDIMSEIELEISVKSCSVLKKTYNRNGSFK